MFGRLWCEESGQGFVEYTLLVLLIATVSIAALTLGMEQFGPVIGPAVAR